MVFMGCNQTHDIKDNAISSENQSDSAEGNKVASEQYTKDILNQLADQDFFIQRENLCNADDETIVEFGKSFVNLFNGAVAEQEKVSFEKYISNKSLLKFTDNMLELTQRQELQGGNAIIYGLKNEFNQAKLQHMDDNLCYLQNLSKYTRLFGFYGFLV